MSVASRTIPVMDATLSMTPLDLGPLPDLPLREYDLTGVLKRPDGTGPPEPRGRTAAVVDAVHEAAWSEWRLKVRAGSAGMALTAAELVLPEAAGATWTVSPANDAVSRTAKS
jgi:hypothetical protein